MKTLCIIIFNLLCLEALMAGNRADINADQKVNAVDLSVLSNLLAGNLDLSNYDIPNVVVVAPTGGDFTNPVDAANYVNTQGFDKAVIVVSPGFYQIDQPIILGQFTVLLGYGDVSSIRRVINTPITTPQDACTVHMLGTGSAIVNCRVGITLSPDISAENYSGVYVTSNAATLKDVRIQGGGYNGYLTALTIDSVGRAFIFNCIMYSSLGGQSTQRPVCIDSSGYISIRGSYLNAESYAASQASYVLLLRPGSETKVYGSQLEAISSTPDLNYYIYRESGAHPYSFFHCVMEGRRSGDANGII